MSTQVDVERRMAAVRQVIGERERVPACEIAEAYAPANIALCKYWGKRDTVLNLPVTSSLSLSLGTLGSRVRISCGDRDAVTLNGKPVAADSAFWCRTIDFCTLLCGADRPALMIAAENSVPTAAGFASSASGFAALTLALDRLMGWALNRRELSVLARLGSGSACRSLYGGFAYWEAGELADGSDSYAEPIDAGWDELMLGLVVVSGAAKETGSREGMQHTRETSPLYALWPDVVTQDIATVREAIEARDFARLGATAEANAMAMHATMIAARPSLCYWHPESLAVLQRVRAARDAGVAVYATMDAGPNVKLLYREQDGAEIEAHFPGFLEADPWCDRDGEPGNDEEVE